MISIHLKHSLEVTLPTLSPRDIGQLAETAIASEEHRIGSATNVHDQPARALSAAYARLKVRQGAQPVRDYRLTGALLSSRHVIAAGDHSATVGFSDSLQEAKAEHIELFEQMFGLSLRDEAVVGNEAGELLAEEIQAAKNR